VKFHLITPVPLDGPKKVNLIPKGGSGIDPSIGYISLLGEREGTHHQKGDENAKSF
jgi:hypothetical protein